VVFNVKGVTDLGRFGWQGPGPAGAEAHGFHLLKETSEEKNSLICLIVSKWLHGG